MEITIQDTIRQYTDTIISGKIPAPTGCCPRCFQQPKTFKLHECRKRSFRYIIGNYVKVLMTLLPRWRCSSCGKTFTVYPPFASPHKRYILDDIKRLSKKYIKDEKQTYSAAVTHDNAPIGYEENDKYVDHFLSSSTLWRWIHWLGTIKTFKKGCPSWWIVKNNQAQCFWGIWRLPLKNIELQANWWSFNMLM